MNRLKSYEQIISKKGLSDYPYIRKFILENESFDKPFVLGAGTSSGKTFMSITWLEMFYMNPKNKGFKTLILPASTVVLRDNYGDSLKQFNPSFTYCICESKDDIKSALKADCDVIVVLPQTAISNINLLKKFHNFILDEAHQWYFQKTINQIIKKIKPKNQILLTGTPAPFVAKKENFQFQFVPVLELFELGKVSNVKIEVVSTSHDFKLSDYNRHNNLNGNVNLHTNAKSELIEVCKEMIKKLRNPIKGYQSFNNLTKNTIGGLFNFLEKTIIFCQSKKQANEFYKVLSKMKDLEGKVLLSHSESDKESLEFRNFKEQSKYQILIAVDRGKLGFNLPDLFNVIDFSFTQNLSMILQMYGRLLRLSNKNKSKIFYKVAPKNMAPYFVDLMTAMCCLLDYEWYSKFNGKNMDEIVIRKVSISKKRTNNKSLNIQKKSTNKLYSIEQLGIPLDLNLLKTNIKHSYDGKFVTVAETTLGDIRRKFFNININCIKKGWTEEKLIEIAKKYKNITSLRKNEIGVYSAIRRLNIEKKAFAHMEKLWSKKTEKDFYSFIKENNIKSRSELWNLGGQWFTIAKRLNINIDSLFPKKYNDDWTSDKIRNVSKNFNDLTKFYRTYPSAYLNAKRLGILEEISKNWSKPARNKKYDKDDIESLKQKIKKAKTRNQARNLISRQAYDFLKENGIIQKFFPLNK